MDRDRILQRLRDNQTPLLKFAGWLTAILVGVFALIGIVKLFVFGIFKSAAPSSVTSATHFPLPFENLPGFVLTILFLMVVSHLFLTWREGRKFINADERLREERALDRAEGTAKDRLAPTEPTLRRTLVQADWVKRLFPMAYLIVAEFAFVHWMWCIITYLGLHPIVLAAPILLGVVLLINHARILLDAHDLTDTVTSQHTLLLGVIPVLISAGLVYRYFAWLQHEFMVLKALNYGEPTVWLGLLAAAFVIIPPIFALARWMVGLSIIRMVWRPWFGFWLSGTLLAASFHFWGNWATHINPLGFTGARADAFATLVAVCLFTLGAFALWIGFGFFSDKRAPRS